VRLLLFTAFLVLLYGSSHADTYLPQPDSLYPRGKVIEQKSWAHEPLLSSELYGGGNAVRIPQNTALYSVASEKGHSLVFYYMQRKRAWGVGWISKNHISESGEYLDPDDVNNGLSNAIKMHLGDLYASQNMSQLFVYVTVSDTTAKIRIMNIVPKFQQGMRVKAGQTYTIEASAQGFQTVVKDVVAVSPQTTVRIALPKNVAARTDSTASKTPSTRKPDHIIRSNVADVLLIPVSQDVIPPSQLRTPGVELPYDYYKNGFGTVAKTLVDRKLDKVIAANVTNVKTTHDTLPADSYFIVLYSVNLYSNYVMYKGSSGNIRFAWLNRVHMKSATQYPDMEVYGHIHPAYFRSALEGYFSKVEPMKFYSKGFEHKLPISPSRTVWLERGMVVPAYMTKPTWKKALVKITYDGNDFYRWVEVENFYKTSVEAQTIVQQNASVMKGQWALFGVTLFCVAMYYLYALGTRSGRNMLATMSYVALDDARKWLTVIVSFFSIWFFYSGTYKLLSVDLQDLTLQTTETEGLYILWCLPGLILLPMFLYIGFVFLQMESSGTPSEKFYQKADPTLDRGQASRENRGINEKFGTLDTDMDGIRAKAETERMNRMQAAMRARTKAYDEFITSAKSQRAAEVEASYGDEK